MAEQIRFQPVASQSMSVQPIRMPSLGQIGAPIGAGSNARALAGALSGFSSVLKGIAKKDEDRAKDLDEAMALEEILTAEREGTLEQLKQKTLSGEIQEGASPAYNDTRKKYLALHSVDTLYSSEIQKNMSVLVDPDVDPEVKQQILSEAYQSTGIDALQINDPIVKKQVLSKMYEVDKRLKGVQAQEFARVNVEKMNNDISKTAFENVKNLKTPEDLKGGVMESLSVIRSVGGRNPTSRVAKEYLGGIEAIGNDDPDFALEQLEALKSINIDGGGQLLGNPDLYLEASNLKNKLEGIIEKNELKAEHQFNSDVNDLVMSAENQLTVENMYDIDEIDKAFNGIIEVAKEQGLSPRHIKKIVEERNMRTNEAMKVGNQKLQQKDWQISKPHKNSQLRAKQVLNATSKEEVDGIVEEINMDDSLTVFEKTQAIQSVKFQASQIKFADGKADSVLTDEYLGVSEDATTNISNTTGLPIEETNEFVSSLRDEAKEIYKIAFANEIEYLAKENSLTPEQAMQANRSIGVPAKEDMKNYNEGDLIFNNAGNYVEQASLKASDVAKKMFTEKLDAYKKQKTKRFSELRQDLSNRIASEDMQADLPMLKDVSKMMKVDPQKAIAGRLAITEARMELDRLADRLNTITESRGLQEGDRERFTKDYYNIQNSIGYTLREINGGRTMSGVEIDYGQIDPAKTQVLWNEREIGALNKLNPKVADKMAKKLKLETREELIYLQGKLLGLSEEQVNEYITQSINARGL